MTAYKLVYDRLHLFKAISRQEEHSGLEPLHIRQPHVAEILTEGSLPAGESVGLITEDDIPQDDYGMGYLVSWPEWSRIQRLTDEHLVIHGPLPISRIVADHPDAHWGLWSGPCGLQMSLKTAALATKEAGNCVELLHWVDNSSLREDELLAMYHDAMLDLIEERIQVNIRKPSLLPSFDEWATETVAQEPETDDYYTAETDF